MATEISHDEYVFRQNRAQELMQAAGLEALLVTDPTNLFYFTGASYFGEMSYPRPAALLIPQKAEAMLLTHDFHLAVPWQGDVREYPKVGELPVDMLKDMFSDAVCESGRIGMELGREQRLGMSYSDFGKVRAALPEIIPIDAAGLIWDIRMQKTAAEVAIIQQVLLAGIEIVKPGIPVSAVYQAQVGKAEELGLDMQTWKARRFGHGSGLHTTEPPYISGDDHTILKSGMILHIEPGSIEKDGIYVREEQVLVTETGCTVLSHAPWQLSQ